MENIDIAKSFNLLGKLMELHGENPFKVRSYYNAYSVLRKQERALTEMSEDEIGAIPGLGTAIIGKIGELNSKGEMDTLERYKSMTPPGVIDMIQVRGFGPKKVSAIWNQLEIDTIGELLQACEENRLVALKGFALKTQDDLKKKLQYYQSSKGFVHFATAENEIEEIQSEIDENFSQDAAIVGDATKQNQIIEGIQILVTEDRLEELEKFILDNSDSTVSGLNYKTIPVYLIDCAASDFAAEQLSLNSDEDYVAYLEEEFGLALEEFPDELNEEAIFEALDIPYLSPPQRELWNENKQNLSENELIQVSDIKGLVHCHSTYSDGLHSLADMAKYAKSQGMDYMLITDHSQSAFYADGLKPDRVLEQWKEIDELNAKMYDFHIFKGIESDILSDGSLDYEQEMLDGFDVIIASIHSNLNMDEEKATKRLIAAIEHPSTRILGHPTGRLLLSRAGYPIDHGSVIDACAEHNVVIELNAHPSRLDLDYHWICYALEKGVKISINPDAHSKEALHLVKHGVRVARKAWVRAEDNLSSCTLEEFKQWIAKKK